MTITVLRNLILALILCGHLPVALAKDLSEEEIKTIFSRNIEAARQGNAKAQFLTAYAYWNGLGVPQKRSLARVWLDKAVDQSYPPATLEKGHRILYGNGYPQDIDAGIALVKNAIELGESQGYTVLGAYYFGVDSGKPPIDVELGKSYLLKGDAAGNQNSMFLLGVVYQGGWASEELRNFDYNISKAIEWYTKAAEHLSVYAIASLGALYSNPDMGRYDLKKAYFWYLLAKKVGATDWRKELISIELRLKKVYRDEADAKTEEWIKKFVPAI